MKRAICIVTAILFVVCCGAASTKACTTFTIKDKNGNTFFGRNFDYMVGDAHVVINKRGLQKTAFIKPPEKKISWTSKYGSVTFNLIGKEFACGGMNEAGLVVEIMRLEETKLPEVDDRFALTVLQWVQYQLDSAGTVDDVIKSDSVVRISGQSPGKNHFLIADRSGKTAVIEYLDGKMRYYTGNSLAYPVLANSVYEESLNSLRKYTGFGGDTSLPARDESSLGRFCKAASLVQKYDGAGNAVDFAFGVLDTVRQEYKSEWKTQWTIVYDINKLQVHYKTRNNKELRKVAFKDFDFGCGQKSQVADIDQMPVKSVFADYSMPSHRNLLDRVFNNVPAFKNVPEERREAFARYSEATTCTAPSPR